MLELGASSYVSIDTNRRDGALDFDLSIPQDFWMVNGLAGGCDIVTNIGTSEHVIGKPPYDVDKVLVAQMCCFRNMYHLCRVGGIMVCQLPPVGKWLDHGEDVLVHYTKRFPGKLAEACYGELVVNDEVYLPTLNPTQSLFMFVVKRGKTGFFLTYDLRQEIQVEIKVGAT